MIQIFEGSAPIGANVVLDNMHRDRKRVFVDLLGWDVPVMDGQFEIDEFDTGHAIYVVDADMDGRHRGSFRFLPTDRPHLLGSIFPFLSARPVPTGRHIWEVTRACLSQSLPASERRKVRNRLITTAVSFALSRGVTRLTCVADSSWRKQILTLGWDVEPLGLPRKLGGVETGALEIILTAATLDQFRAAGTYEPAELVEGVPATQLAA
jgi:acyl-homoserine lactone synthase